MLGIELADRMLHDTHILVSRFVFVFREPSPYF